MKHLLDNWLLDPQTVFLNHGSYGACLREVIDYQQTLQRHIEHQPVAFFIHELPGRIHEARAALADFLGASTDCLAFVPNATTGVNTVLRSLTFNPGDEILLTNHTYNACRNAVDFVAARWGATAVVVDVPFPIHSNEELIDIIVGAVSPNTKLALLDHITSPTALVLPIASLVERLEAMGVDTLVDGAHGPGMLELNLDKLGAAYYTGNCHKWLCTPKGAAILYVRADKQDSIRPLSISHGANRWDGQGSRYLCEFDWTGTSDPTAILSIPQALEVLEKLMPNGWPDIWQHNHDLALYAQELLCEALEIPPPCPADMLGAMAAVPLALEPLSSPGGLDPLQTILMEEYSIEVPVSPPPENPTRTLRISAQLYNTPDQYQLLARALREIQQRHNIRLGTDDGRM